MNYDNVHLANRSALLKEHAAFLSDKVFLEFGVCRGTSMLMWYDLYLQHNIPIDFIGFDSFQGLPEEHEDKNTIWKAGQFSTDGQINKELLNRKGIWLVPGFYNESLNETSVDLLRGKKAGLVHIDCDTYSSTKTVWEWLLKNDLLAKGCIIAYDDWGAYLEARCGEYEVGEAKAHKEVAQTHNLSLKDLGKYVVDPRFYEVKLFQYE